MVKQVGNKFVWLIKSFSSLKCEKCYSVPVMAGDCKWHLLAYPKGENKCDHLSLFLEVADVDTLPRGWVRYVKLRLTIVNQLSQKLSIMEETEGCFDRNSTSLGFPSILTLPKLHDNNGGFLACGDLVIVAELDVLEVIGTLDSSKKSQEASEYGNDIADGLDVIGTLDSSEKSQEASEHSVESNDLADDLEATCTLKDEPAVRQETNYQRPKRKIVLPRRYRD